MKLNRLINRAKYEVASLRYMPEDKKVKKLIAGADKPVYYYHIRKTAGTTVNYAFLQYCQAQDMDEFFEVLARKPNNRLVCDKKVFVGWNVRLINKAKYSYAFSHTPYHRLKIPSNVFTFTCFRDPAKRIVSLYNYLRNFQVNNIYHPCMKREEPWLGNSFDDFLNNIPKAHLKNQLYMFSDKFDINEAYDRIMGLDYFFSTSQISEGLGELEQRLNWKLPVTRRNKSGYSEDISNQQLERLRQMLEDEYMLIDQLNMKGNPF